MWCALLIRIVYSFDIAASSLQIRCVVEYHATHCPNFGSVAAPISFLAECRKRRLNQGSQLFAVFCVVCYFSCCTVLFVSISQVIDCEDLWNDVYCVAWDVELYINSSGNWHTLLRRSTICVQNRLWILSACVRMYDKKLHAGYTLDIVFPVLCRRIESRSSRIILMNWKVCQSPVLEGQVHPHRCLAGWRHHASLTNCFDVLHGL